jgi:cobalt-zinc-cadmium efflux system protein
MCGVVSTLDRYPSWRPCGRTTAHLARPDAGPDERLLSDAAHELDHRFGIRHATIQVEAECHLAPAHVV